MVRLISLVRVNDHEAKMDDFHDENVSDNYMYKQLRYPDCEIGVFIISVVEQN